VDVVDDDVLELPKSANLKTGNFCDPEPRCDNFETAVACDRKSGFTKKSVHYC